MNTKNDVAQTGNFQINCRQLCFFCAFFIPLGKILEAPRIFAQYAAGDLLLPAFLQFVLQGIAFTLLLFAAAKAKKPLLDALEDRIGKTGMKIFYFVCSAFFIFSSLLPLLDLDKFCYAAFSIRHRPCFRLHPFSCSARFCV